MQTLDWYYHRLTRMGAAEILWRVRGAAREAFDLIRLPLGAFPKLSSPAAWSQFSPGIVLRPSHTTLPSTRRAVLVAQAESILDNRLSYFQHNDLHLGQPMDWHRDWNQGLSSPLAMCPLVDYRVAHVSGDCKEVWEPNRHHQLVVLARAWHVTKDPRYADGVWAVLRSWLDANPFGHGMNWKSPLELGVRVINWIWALDLVRGHPCDESLWQRVHAAIHQHVWDLARKFSRGSSANNHLVGEAAGVFVATIWLPHLPKAMELRDLARQILIEEIEKQFHVDGGTREQALGYQFFSIQFFTICALLAQRSGNAMPAVYMQRLRAAYGYLAAFGEGGFDLPFYGDKDDGYVLDLGDGSHNVQAVPALASVLFEGKQVSTSEAAYWLFDAAVQDVSTTDGGQNAANSLESRTFVDAGHYLMQCGQANDRICVHIDCAPLGYGSIAAHGHADALAFTLRMGGLQMLVDPGTFDYFTQPQWRDAFRHTRAHNTVCIDDENQSELLGAFLWGRQAVASCEAWEDDPALTFFRGQHDGYQVLPDPVHVERSYCLDKSRRSLHIEDDLVSRTEHDYAAGFHFHPDCQVTVAGSVVSASRANQTLTIGLPGGVRVDVYRGDEQAQLGWFSAGYHHKTPATTVVVRKRFTGKLKMRYEFAMPASATARLYDLNQRQRAR